MNDEIRIAGIVEESIVDGPGIRYVLFTQGCPHNCKGCHNPQTHDFNMGRMEKCENIINMIDSNPLLKGITLSGGEPFMQAEKLANLINKVGNKKLDVMTYTGFKFEYLLENANDENKFMNLLEKTDILIDGKFEMDKKDENLLFRGSSNQRAIDVKESLKTGKIIEYEF
ncbi:MAG: anaerobic ribonucleoside-triphosphate reductase activating protein [Clostridia bacterium]|nr:anaerobic ribonucleoside-triphosphate reductase activating protein [Clostridia bacterium]